MQAFAALSPHVVFNLVETLAGKGSLIYFAPALLDFLKIPYTGCRTDAMFLTSNKPLTKKIMQGAGIATPPGLPSEGIAIGSCRCRHIFDESLPGKMLPWDWMRILFFRLTDQTISL